MTDNRVQLTAAAEADLRHPQMDDRVIRILHSITEHYRFAISVVKTGHSRCVGGGSSCPDDDEAFQPLALPGRRHLPRRRPARQRRQPAGPPDRGVDITITGDLQPDGVGSPFSHWTHLPGWFTDSNHQGHIHIGYGAP